MGLAGDLPLQVQHPQGGAALTGAEKSRADHIVGDLFQQRRRIHDHGILAAGLGDQRSDGSVGFGHGPIDPARGFSTAGEGDTGAQRMPNQSVTHGAIANQQITDCLRRSRGMQQPHGFESDNGRFLRRLGGHGIACRQRGADLAAEDRQREIPWTDTNEHAPPAEFQFVALAGGTGQGCAFLEALPRLGSVVAAEVYGFAYFVHGIRKGFARLAAENRDQLRTQGFETVRESFQHLRPLLSSAPVPFRLGFGSALEGGFDFCIRACADFTQNIGLIRGDSRPAGPGRRRFPRRAGRIPGSSA